jgi:hypothetical protein
MSRQVISFDKGSKRRIQDIRWKRHEVIGIVSLSLITIFLGCWLALQEVSDWYHPPRTPEVKPLP